MYNIIEYMNQTNLKLWSEFLDEVMSEQPDWTAIAFDVTIYTIFVVSLIGNLLTCIVIYYDKTMHTVTNYYLFDLAVSDIIVSFGIFLDFKEDGRRSPNFKSGDSTKFDQLTCKMHFFFVVVLWYNGILIMTALAIERYIAICYPMMLQSKPVWRRVVKIIALIWVIAIAEAISEFWTVDLIITKRHAVCFLIPTEFGKVLNGVMAMLTFIVPFAIMIFVYTAVAFKVNIAQKNSRRNKIFNHRDNRRKVNKLTVTLTMSFLICWFPFFIMRAMFVLDVRHIMKLKSCLRLGWNITALCSWLSTVLNPLLFSLMSIKFRKALKAFWNTRFKSQHQKVRSSII